MRVNKKLIMLLAIISLFVCISLIQSTYAKYVTNTSANASLTIARWSILVNTQDVVQNSDFSEVITPVFAGTTNIKEGVIAPTANGYFDVIINGTNADVSFQYSISADLSAQNTVTDLKITDYEIGGVTQSYTHGNTISNSILLSQPSRTATIRFYVTWYENPVDETMDNEADTNATVNGIAAVEVNLNLIQIQ